MSKPYRNAGLAAIFIILCIGAFFMANVPMPPWAHLASGLNIILFSIPTIIAAVYWLGRRDAFVLFAVLGVFALTIETVAISTGFPYGHFSYSEMLGYRLFGKTPWTVMLAWTPLILAAFVIAEKLLSSLWLKIVAIALLLTAFDLVLDPGAVKLGFWEFSDGGWYYAVPWSNFAGWVFSGLIGAGILHFILGRIGPLLPAPVQMIHSGFLTLFFWTAFAAFSSMLIPVLVGLISLILMIVVYRAHYYSFDDMVVLVDEQNKPIATAPKLPIHSDETPLHRAFSVFLFNRSGQLLLQRRAEHKKTWGGIWSNSCCGHLMLHESVLSAAKRRLKYELGMNGIDLEVVLPEYRYRAEKDGIVENELCPVLVGFTNADPELNPDEVADFRWVDWMDFVDQVSEPENAFSPWAIEETMLLEQSSEFRDLYQENTSIRDV
ncbi:MAG: isopentenyl-diphosphate Delta-isomerase [Pyrinomonadaceae bacterium]|nr:isopentenyl-diphosphate Delta-isomerase [Pyrinomonadaceae bacterium]